jgi:hypothetical protein
MLAEETGFALCSARPAPKEQPPRNLSGKRDRKLMALWKAAGEGCASPPKG